MRLELRPPQRPMVDWLLKHPRCALYAGMGTGKTSAALYALGASALLDIFEPPVLVVAPKRVAHQTWPDEIRKWENFKGLRFETLTNPSSVTSGKLTADLYTTNYERLPALVEKLGARWPFRTVIADESDRLKGFRLRQGGKRAQAIARVAHTLVKRWVNLTGTPSPNGLADLWGQTWYLDRGERLGRTFQAFTQRWFRPNFSGFGIEPMPFSEQQIHKALADICLTVDAKDYYDLRDPIVTRVPVKLPPRARTIYKKLEKEMFAELLTGDVEVFNAAALTSKCLQLANGALYLGRDGEWETIHDEKIDALRSIQGESGGAPLLVAYQFRSDLGRLKVAFPRGVDISTTDGMAAFRGGHAPMGFAHPKSMGHGIDGLQQVTNILVRFGHDWNLGERMQMIERIGPMRQLQAGLDREVRVYDICAEDTLDDDVIAAHTHKRRVQDALLEATKRRE